MLTISNSTIWVNHASPVFIGGGIQNGGTVTFSNSIVAGNFHADPNVAYDVEGFIDPSQSRSNLIGADLSRAFVNGVNGNIVGVVNPRLGPLAENGGPTRTVALLPGSPAIDAGDNSLV